MDNEDIYSRDTTPNMSIHGKGKGQDDISNAITPHLFEEVSPSGGLPLSGERYDFTWSHDTARSKGDLYGPTPGCDVNTAARVNAFLNYERCNIRIQYEHIWYHVSQVYPVDNKIDCTCYEDIHGSAFIVRRPWYLPFMLYIEENTDKTMRAINLLVKFGKCVLYALIGENTLHVESVARSNDHWIEILVKGATPDTKVYRPFYEPFVLWLGTREYLLHP